MRKVYPFLIIISGAYFLSAADIFQRFMPRSRCMFENKKLINLHLLSDFVIFVSYIGIGGILLRIYYSMKAKGFPFSQFFWSFGGFIFFCGLTHLVGVLNIFITYYWIDGIVKLITAWFSILVLISLIRAYPEMKNIKTPREFEELRRKLDEVMNNLKQKE